MAYETGAATSQHDLLDKLRLFLIAQGWTVDKWDDDTSSHYQAGLSTAGKRLHVHLGSLYFHFRSCVRAFPFSDYSTGYLVGGYQGTGQQYESEISGIALYGSTGYNGALDWDEQPGYPAGTASVSSGCCMNFITGACTYYFFSSANAVVVAVEYTAGKYQWMTFGQLVTFGVVTGGEFFAGTAGNMLTYISYVPCSGINHWGRFFGQRLYNGWISTAGYNFAVRLNVDGLNTWRVSYGGYRGSYNVSATHEQVRAQCLSSISGVDTSEGFPSPDVFNHLLMWRSPSTFNGIAALLPVLLTAERSDGVYSPIGYIDILRQVNMMYKAAGDEITLGGDTWKCLPQSALTGETNNNVGFAVLK